MDIGLQPNKNRPHTKNRDSAESPERSHNVECSLQALDVGEEPEDNNNNNSDHFKEDDCVDTTNAIIEETSRDSTNRSAPRHIDW